MNARSGHCHTCGMRIRPKAKDMSLGAAVRKHYWRHHPERYLDGQAKARWAKREKTRKRSRVKQRAR